MNKKLLVFAVSTLLAGTAFAAKKAAVITTPVTPAPVPQAVANNFTGFYAGVGVLHANMNAEESIAEIYAGTNYTLNNNAGFDQIGEKLFAGYGKSFDRYYLGLEAIFQYLPDNGGNAIKDGKPYGTDGFSARNTWALTLRGGYVCNDNWMPYLLLGTSYTDFKYTSEDLVATSALGSTAMHNLSKRMWGFTPGIGVQYMLNKNFGFDMRYAYTYYGSTTANVTSTLSGVSNFTVKFKPTMSVFGLSILYRF